MEQDWKEITSDLYSKIAPIGGVLHSQIDNSFDRTKKIVNIWIEFEMNEFIYNDPFYGEQKSTDPFNMCIELYDYMSSLEINSIYDLQGKTIIGGKEDKIGSFSNSPPGASINPSTKFKVSSLCWPRMRRNKGLNRNKKSGKQILSLDEKDLNVND